MLPASFTIPGMTEEEFLDLCSKFPDAFVEYGADGTVTIMPPTDPESSERTTEVAGQLRNWAWEHGGRFSGPDGGFRLPDGARLSPDAAWFDADRWKAAQRKGTRFPPFAPDFVIEVRSPDDRPRVLQDKMEEYMANGVRLGWLIDPIDRTVTVYRPGRTPEVLVNPAAVEGEGPVAGFVLLLNRVFTSPGTARPGN